MFQRAQKIEVMVDLAARLRMMDEFPGYRQVVSLSSPPIEALDAVDAATLARIANDGLAAAVAGSEGAICGFVASLPLNDVAASLTEARRAVEQLEAVGVQVFTSVLGQPLDQPRFRELFALMAELDRPVLLHPARPMSHADYRDEANSKYDLWWALGWPHETTLAMVRLVMSGIFDELPHLKIVAHHVGGTMPMLAGRLGPGMELLGTRNPPDAEEDVAASLQEPVVDACARFYADTASFGSRASIACGLDFFGADRLLFATDMPFDPGQGPDYIRSTLKALAELPCAAEERRQILAGNARRVFRLGA